MSADSVFLLTAPGVVIAICTMVIIASYIWGGRHDLASKLWGGAIGGLLAFIGGILVVASPLGG